MRKKLFCEISPLTYSLSIFKCKQIRNIKNIIKRKNIAKTKLEEKLPYKIYTHNSLIRRKLGNVDMTLQENKAINLKIAAPKISHIIIKPGETFSFWYLVGSCTKQKGYKDGLTVGRGTTGREIGGGICQFTNLIHWMVLHTPLTIVEHHHHDGIDMFPDFNRQVPFGVGTSIYHNYVDYQFINNTNITFQLITYTNETHLCGEIRSDKSLSFKYHIYIEEEYFYTEDEVYYRYNKIRRKKVDKTTGLVVEDKLIKENNSRVMYDYNLIDKSKIKEKITS